MFDGAGPGEGDTVIAGEENAGAVERCDLDELRNRFSRPRPDLVALGMDLRAKLHRTGISNRAAAVLGCPKGRCAMSCSMPPLLTPSGKLGGGDLMALRRAWAKASADERAAFLLGG